MTPKFSVIIPTFNRSEFILDAIDSVLSQSFTELELLVIDDDSQDSTIERIQSVRDERFSLIQNESNRGVSYSRNRGIAHSTGEYIAFLDSDDLWLDRKLEHQTDFLKSHPEILICHTNEKWKRNNKHVNQKKIHQKQGGFFFDRSLERCLVSPSSVVIHRKVFEQFGQFDERLLVAEDYELWLRLNNQLPFGYIEEPLVIKRGGHDHQLSQTLNMDKYRILGLYYLLTEQELSPENRALALDMINKKLEILENGALKRKNEDIIVFCNDIKTKLNF